MKKKKTLLIIGIVFLTLALAGIVLGLKFFRSPDSKASPENRPQNIRLDEVTATSATISWTTETPAYGFVSYGKTMSLGNTVQADQRAAVHTVTIPNLSPQTTYYYKIGVGEEIYDNDGVPYSFTTPKESGTQDPLEASDGADLEEPLPTEEQLERETTSSADIEEEEESEPAEQIELSEQVIRDAIGTDDPRYDLNGDGIVNAIDVLLYRNQTQ
ncbi:MAG: fibronectin type III domain-containing protein [Patescibacteria group bacterium]|nr:fibronectin type III domain-containing protein [Patescibacteria group bacterium]